VDLVNKKETMEIHLTIAKTATGCLAIAEYQKATKMAQKEGSREVLKNIYLQQILASVDVRLRECSQGIEPIDKYMELDSSNAKVLACRGVALIFMGDYIEAVAAFKKSLDINDRDEDAGLALLQTMFEMSDYESMLSEIQRYGLSTFGFWLRSSTDDYMHIGRVLTAARLVNKLDLLIRCFESEMENLSFSKEDIEGINRSKLEDKPGIRLNIRRSNLAMSSMFRVYLGWLYLEFAGQPDEALKLWQTAFFERNEFLGLGRFKSSQFETEIIPKFFSLFSQLIYEKALHPDLQIAAQMLAQLRKLQRRERAYQELFQHGMVNSQNINLLLAKLGLKQGRKEEARKMLNDQFQSAVNILQDDIDWNDRNGYDSLGRLLFLNGQLDNAKLALSLKRYFYVGFKRKPAIEAIGQASTESETKDDNTQTGTDDTKEQDQASEDVEYDQARTFFEQQAATCSSQLLCESGMMIPHNAVMYTCTTCVNVDFCESCYENLQNQSGGLRIYLCNPNHEFLKSPADGLEEVNGGKMTGNGMTISFVDWLEEVRKEWNTGICFEK
jgi:tetratricopeptide (TPR) repeat protein